MTTQHLLITVVMPLRLINCFQFRLLVRPHNQPEKSVYVMHQNVGSVSSISISNHTHEVANSFTYHGFTICEAHSLEAKLNKRLSSSIGSGTPPKESGDNTLWTNNRWIKVYQARALVMAEKHWVSNLPKERCFPSMLRIEKST